MTGPRAGAVYRGIRAMKSNAGQWLVMVELPGELIPGFGCLADAMVFIDNWKNLAASR